MSAEWSAALGFVPGILGVAVLLAAGMTREEIYLVAKPISRTGLAVLVAIFGFALAAILRISTWTERR